MNIERLIKVSTYAKQEGISTQAVYLRIKKGKLKATKIDGTTFIQQF